MQRTVDAQRQLDVVQQITHVGSWEWDLATGSVVWSDELYRIYGLAPRWARPSSAAGASTGPSASCAAKARYAPSTRWAEQRLERCGWVEADGPLLRKAFTPAELLRAVRAALP
jgi:hypothetical protein